MRKHTTKRTCLDWADTLASTSLETLCPQEVEQWIAHLTRCPSCSLLRLQYRMQQERSCARGRYSCLVPDVEPVPERAFAWRHARLLRHRLRRCRSGLVQLGAALLGLLLLAVLVLHPASWTPLCLCTGLPLCCLWASGKGDTPSSRASCPSPSRRFYGHEPPSASPGILLPTSKLNHRLHRCRRFHRFEEIASVCDGTKKKGEESKRWWRGLLEEVSSSVGLLLA